MIDYFIKGHQKASLIRCNLNRKFKKQKIKPGRYLRKDFLTEIITNEIL